ncbi:hypothetical protein MNBD_ALPHA08-1523 [hydrothermal vent metagenome]|uniref:Uncharacterized protein n=1 Tax=hydrothermal vent metagenome TaxID=652676 RepID=A0A3B0RF39_9ZZZZ
MRKLTHMVISLPLLVAPLALVGVAPVKAQQVQNVGPTGAVKLLAQSTTADAKCRYLTRSENAELSDYLTKAEVGAAGMTTAGDAQQARRDGKKLGKTMACGQTGEGLVRATLDAARRAMAAARAQQKSKKVVTRQQPQRRIVVRRQSDRQLATIGNITSLTRYRRVTEAYYLERRCQTLPRSQAVRFWKKVVASHNAVLKKYTPSQVKKAKNGAEMAANNRGPCSSRTARIVQSGLRS